MDSSFQKITPDMICGVVVAYEPDSLFITRLSILIQQLPKLMVIDNSSVKNVDQLIGNDINFVNLTLISNKQNLGLGFALNQGVIEAKKLGYRFVILFDQDSRIFPDSVSRMCSVFDGINDSNVGVLGASYKQTLDDRSKTKSLDDRSKTKSLALMYIKKKSNITSGSLIPINVFDRVGLFRSDYFIDCIDSEFCFRLRKNGFSIYQTATPLMEHAVGSPTIHKFLNYKYVSTNHSADRRYYIARNHLVMLREYNNQVSKAPFFWVFKAIKRSFYFALVVILFEQQKMNKLKAIIMGIKDGFFNNMGRRS